MKINDISPKTNQTSLTNKDNADFGFRSIVRDMAKTKQELENTECSPQVERRTEQGWLPGASHIPIANVRVKKENCFIDIIKDAVNLSTDDIDSLINELIGEDFDVADLESCLDLFIEISGREVK